MQSNWADLQQHSNSIEPFTFVSFKSMKEADLFFLFLFITSLGLLIAGLYKPWVVLWWEDVQNRRKVFKVYGTATLLALITFLVLVFYY